MHRTWGNTPGRAGASKPGAWSGAPQALPPVAAVAGTAMPKSPATTAASPTEAAVIDRTPNSLAVFQPDAADRPGVDADRMAPPTIWRHPTDDHSCAVAILSDAGSIWRRCRSA